MDDEGLAELARRLRDAAVEAGRPDVAAKAGEAIALLSGKTEAANEPDRANTVVRFLDGLGF
ncbi:MAG TPA: hypothetical protein VFH03_28260 [Actinoplanes sp.]|nr:hypothetical protein [Actinoplanes sp.]